MRDVGRKMAAGVAWMVLFKLAERGLGFISTLILARLLVPADFGLVAMATAFVAMLELLSAFGFDIALIRRQDAGREHYDTAWTFSVVVGAALALVMLAISGAVAEFYREPAVQPLIWVLAVGSLVQGFENIGVVAFRKELAFDKEFRFQLAKKLAMFVVTVPLAFALRSYWALVVGIVAGRVASVLLSYRVHPYRPRFSLAAWSDLIHFSKWLLLNNALAFLRERTSDLVVGRLQGPRALGLYNVAYEISNLPTTELVMPINRAVFPAYARMSSDPSVLREGFLNVLGVIALLTVPAGAGIAATAHLLTPVLLGAKWVDAVASIELLAFFGITMSLQTNSYSVYLAIGKPHLQAIMSGVFLAILIPTMIHLAQQSGSYGAAQACLLAGAALLPVNYAVALTHLRLGPLPILALWWRPFSAGAAMYWIVRTFLEQVSPPAYGLAGAAWLLAACLIGLVSYFVIIVTLWAVSGRPRGPESLLVDRLRAARKPQSAAGDA